MLKAIANLALNCFVLPGTQSTQVPQLSAEKNQSTDVQFIAAFKRIGFGTQRGLSPQLSFFLARPFEEFFQLFSCFSQFKFLDKDEFRDVKRLTKVLLDGNQLSVVVDQLFRMQKSLNHLGASHSSHLSFKNSQFLSISLFPLVSSYSLQIYRTIGWPKCPMTRFFS